MTGLSEKTKVAKSGNSLVLRIKKNLAKHLGLTEGTEVVMTPWADGLIVSPI